jgi:hypothetical protein
VNSLPFFRNRDSQEPCGFRQIAVACIVTLFIHCLGGYYWLMSYEPGWLPPQNTVRKGCTGISAYSDAWVPFTRWSRPEVETHRQKYRSAHFAFTLSDSFLRLHIPSGVSVGCCTIRSVRAWQEQSLRLDESGGAPVCLFLRMNAPFGLCAKSTVIHAVFLLELRRYSGFRPASGASWQCARASSSSFS